MTDKLFVRAATLIACVAVPIALASCGGGGGGGGAVPSGPTYTPPVATPTPPPGFTASTQATSAQLPAVGSYSGSILVPAGSGSATIATSLSNPSGTPVLQIVHSKTLQRDTVNTPLLYITITAQTGLSLNGVPGFNINVAPGITGNVYLAAYENPWTTVSGPVTVSNGVASFAIVNGQTYSLTTGQSGSFALYEGGIVPTPTATPSPTPTPTATPTPVPTPAYTTGPGQSLTGPATYGSSGWWGPSSVANALNFPVQWGWNGAGQTVAIITDEQYTLSDIQSYNAYFETPATGNTISYVPIAGGAPAGAGLEANLDTETILGLAPGANVVVYEMPDLAPAHLIDALEAITTESSQIRVVSYSAAGCETSYDATTVSPVIQAAAAAYIDVIASAGDEGSDCYTGTAYTFGVGYPASDPNAIGVGGTETGPGYSLTSTRAWNDTACGNSNGPGVTGGGVSTFFSIPSFQVGVSGESSTTYRNVPDIALPACGTAVLLSGVWEGAGGTSWSAPQVAAMMAEIDQFCAESFNSGAAPLYTFWGLQGYNDFIDVVAGNNSWNGSSPYSAAPGFDNVSGIGVPLGMNFAGTICPDRNPIPAIRSKRVQQLPESTSPVREPASFTRSAPDLGEESAQTTINVTLVLKPSMVSAANEQMVVDTLVSNGFTILKRYANHLVIDAQAPSSVVEQTFATTIHQYNQGRYGTRYANATALTIPPSLSAVVGGVIADNFVTMSHR